MKAAVYEQYGPPSVVKIREVPKPSVGEKEVLIKVMASTVNRTDTGFRSAEYFISRFFSGLFRPKTTILGNEFAGVVEAIGNTVTTLKIGDSVFGYNDSTFGGHAEYLTIPETSPVTTIPQGFSFAEAAALTEGGHYALCDIRAAKVTTGQRVLVNGATGAIGSAAVQLLKYLGAEVTAVCATPYVQLVKSLGADTIIDYTQQDFTKLDTSFDFVFDAVGKSTFGKCTPLLKQKGIYISTELGPYGQNPWLALFTPLFRGKRLLFPLPTISKADVVFLKDLAEKGFFKPLLDRTYTLDQIVEAHEYAQSGQKIGNVIVSISQP
jgi:NADPH:quinone reductase-like Zn-dependent oxidoreductase